MLLFQAQKKLKVFLAVHTGFGLRLDQFKTVGAFFFVVGLENPTDGNIAIRFKRSVSELMISDGIYTGEIVK